MITAGIDIGSITTKAAIVDEGDVIGTRVAFTGYNANLAGRSVYEGLLDELGVDASSVEKIISTGYGETALILLTSP